jgi:hypothetical protein
MIEIIEGAIYMAMMASAAASMYILVKILMYGPF